MKTNDHARELLGVELPIIQAPMAGVQDSSLAIAVARAGGLGSLPCAMLSTDQLESELQIITSSINTPINLNFFCHSTPDPDPKADAQWQETLRPFFEEFELNPDSISSGANRQPFSHDIADIIEPYSPTIVSFHFGLPPKNLLERVKHWGTTVLSSATTTEEALWLEANGVDLIIAQGLEAGGHRGMFIGNDLASQSNTELLLPNIIEKVGLPVIAAGGISTGSDLANTLGKGAFAAQIGTAYLLCNEAKTSTLHRAAIQANSQPNTTLTNLFSGKPARSIVNRVIKELGAINQNAPEFPFAARAITALRSVAESNNSSDFSPLWCGQNTQGCQPISAHELTLKLASAL